MAELLRSILSTTKATPPLINIEDAEVYSEYAAELKLLHSISAPPEEEVVDSLLAKINLLTQKNKYCVS